jgi:hypothetical protein
MRCSDGHADATTAGAVPPIERLVAEMDCREDEERDSP